MDMDDQEQTDGQTEDARKVLMNVTPADLELAEEEMKAERRRELEELPNELKRDGLDDEQVKKVVDFFDADAAVPDDDASECAAAFETWGQVEKVEKSIETLDRKTDRELLQHQTKKLAKLTDSVAGRDYKPPTPPFDEWAPLDTQGQASGPASPPSPASEPAAAAPETYKLTSSLSESARQRQERRYQMCVDAGLEMPTDDYRRLPRGIGNIAKREGITRQSLSEDLKAHIRFKNSTSR